MIVDDNNINVLSLEKMIKKIKLDVQIKLLIANDGAEAVEQFKLKNKTKQS